MDYALGDPGQHRGRWGPRWTVRIAWSAMRPQSCATSDGSVWRPPCRQSP